jgi:CheY-like chemotaxis protein
MDINLPGIDGFAALKLLRADPVTCGIPVIPLSVNSTAHDVAQGLTAGFFSYLTKPLVVPEFLDALDRALAGPAVATPRHT